MTVPDPFPPRTVLPTGPLPVRLRARSRKPPRTVWAEFLLGVSTGAMAVVLAVTVWWAW